MLPAGSGSASAFKNNEDRWRMIKKMSKDATKCDQEELCQLFGGVSEMKYIFLLFLSHGFKSQAAHLYIATGDQVKVRACFTKIKRLFFLMTG